MQGPITWLGSAAMSAILIVSAVAHCAEEKITPNDVPKAVMQAVKARFKDAVVTGAIKEETDEGDVVYEVSLTLKGQTIDVTLTPEGKIVLFEESIAAGDLPKAVAKALEDMHPQATYKRLERVVKVEKGKEKLDFYEAQIVTAEKEEVEVKLTADGKIVDD